MIIFSPVGASLRKGLQRLEKLKMYLVVLNVDPHSLTDASRGIKV